MQAGLDAARGHVVALMDADLQMTPLIFREWWLRKKDMI